MEIPKLDSVLSHFATPDLNELILCDWLELKLALFEFELILVETKLLKIKNKGEK